MPRVYYDDGSWIDTDSSGTTIAANTDGVAVSRLEADGDYFRSSGYWSDAREAQKLEQFVPRPNGDTRPWFERVAEYGVTRAIDNHFGPTSTDKTSAAPSFAGQNGRTYSQVGGAQPQAHGMSWLPIALAAVAGFFLLG